MRITNLLKTKLAGLLVVALCASLVVPALAGAQQVDPTTSQYGGQLSQINTGGKGGQPPANTTNSGTNSGAPAASPGGTGLSGHVGPLPFTGFDVIAMAAVALAVTGLGLGLQRAVSRETTDDLA